MTYQYNFNCCLIEWCSKMPKSINPFSITKWLKQCLHRQSEVFSLTVAYQCRCMKLNYKWFSIRYKLKIQYVCAVLNLVQKLGNENIRISNLKLIMIPTSASRSINIKLKMFSESNNHRSNCQSNVLVWVMIINVCVTCCLNVHIKESMWCQLLKGLNSSQWTTLTKKAYLSNMN